MSETLRWTQVASFGAVYEAEQAVAMLEEAGISATVGDDTGASVALADEGAPPQTVTVMVPEHQALEARELLTVDPPEV